MKQSLKIWVIVVAMVMGGALPPQVMGDSSITTQWCAQAKSKNKKKSSKKDKKSKKKDKKKSKQSDKATASPLVSVPTIGKTTTTTVVPQQNTNSLLAVTISIPLSYRAWG